MKMIQKGYVFLCLLFLLSACSKENAYEAVLPKDAALVVSADMVSMAEKVGLSGKEGGVIVARLSDVLKSGMQGSEQLIDKIVKNPAESGMDLKRKVYFFVESQAVSAGALICVKDKGKIDDFLAALHAQQLCEEVREDDGCSWTIAGKGLVAYSDDAFLILVDPKGGEPMQLQHTAALLLRQKEEESFSMSEEFGRINDALGDIVAFSSLDFLSGQYIAPLLMGASGELNLQNVKALTTVRFEQGKMVMDVENLTTDKIVLEMQKRLGQVIQPLKGTYLDAFPANTFYWLSFNVEGGKLYDWLCENPMLSQQLENSMMPLDFEAIFRSIKGDVALAFPQSDANAFIVYADVTNSQFLQTFEDIKPLLALTGGQMKLLNRGTDAYEFRVTDGTMLGIGKGYTDFWFGVKNNRLYFTNQESLVNAWLPGLKLRDAAWAKSVSGKRFFMGANAIPAKGIWQNTSLVSEGVDYLTLSVTDERHISLEVVMKDKSQNILSYLLRTLK